MLRARWRVAAKLAAVCVAVATGIGVLPAGAADPVLDANTLPLTRETTGVGMAPGFPLAQTFVARHDGPVARVDLGVHRYGTGSLQSLSVQLAEVEGGQPAAVLAATAVPASALGTRAQGVVPAVFDTPPAVVAGRTYALVLEPTGGCCVFLRYGQPIGAYADGMLLWRDGGVWVPWISPAPGVADALFAVWVLTADDVPPVVDVPAVIEDEITDPEGVEVAWTATATDDVDGSLPVTCTPASGSRFPFGNTKVTCEATDAAGNVGTASIRVHIFDATPPTIDFAGDGRYGVDDKVSVQCWAEDRGSGVAWTTCGEPYEADAWQLGPGDHLVPATAVDVAGNRADDQAAVHITVDVDSLAALVHQWVSNQGVARSLEMKLRAGRIDAFNRQLAAMTPRFVTAERAEVLTRLASSL